MQTFCRQMNAHNAEIPHLRHCGHLLRQSSVAQTVNSNVQELTDKWNRLTTDATDREVHIMVLGEMLVASPL